MAERTRSASVQPGIDGRVSWNRTRPAGRADFFTAGYSGRTLDELIDAFCEHRVRTLADIRRNAVSRHRPEMSKNNLAKRLAASGIEYVHLPQFGVPRDVRSKAAAAGSAALWDWYDRHLDVQQALQVLKNLNGPAAFLCMEADPRECHRHRLSLALEAHGRHGFDL